MDHPPKKTVPKHIIDAIKEGEARLEASQAVGGTPAGSPQPAAPAAPKPPVELPPIPQPATAPAPAAAAAEPPQPQVVDLGIGGEPPAPQPHTPGPKPGEAPEETIRRLQAALTVLQGKYNAEVPGLMREAAEFKARAGRIQEIEAENTKLKQETQELEKRLAEAEAKAASAPAAPAAAALSVQALQGLADNWGIDVKELVQFQRNTIEAVMASMPKPQPSPAPVPAPAPQPAAPAPAPPQPVIAPEKQLYLSTLDTLIGENEAQGTALRAQTLRDPLFNTFLDLPSTGGRSVREVAIEAEQSNNAVVMSRIYGKFFEWRSRGGQEPRQPATNLMPAPAGGPVGDLNSQQKPVYTSAQEAEFQSRVRRQYYSGIGKTPDEAKKLADEYRYWSNEFASARAEGRIRG